VNAPVFDLISILRELETYKDWWPLLYKSEQTHEFSNQRFMGEVKLKIPWPYDNRSLYLKCCSIPAESGDGVMVLIKSLSDKILGMDIEKDT
jgi:hypothetical protein